MNDEILIEQVKKSTQELGELIRTEYEQNPTGIIKGYALFEKPSEIMEKKKLRRCYKLGEFNTILECDLPVYERYSAHVRPLVNMLICYMVRNNLVKELEEYHFKKLEISTDLYHNVPVYELRIKW